MPVSAGATNLYLAKHTRVFLAQGSNIWEIPVLDGYSFSQATNTSEITLSEMTDATGASRRAKQVVTDSLAPSEWSFSTYAKPYLVTGTPDVMHCVEEPLWANFVATNVYTPATPAWSKAITLGTGALDIDFNDSNFTTLGTFDLYFVLGAANVTGVNYLADGDTTIYKITGAVTNEVSVTFDIEGITTLAWSGFGESIEEVTSYNATGAIVAGITDTSNFIRNRLTALTANSSISGSSVDYDITLTGGSITINNGITFLTPETIGRVNKPIGHVAGTRSVSGTFTAYLDEKTNSTIDLFEDISTNLLAVTNSFALDFYVGGKDTGDAPVAPGLQFKIPKAHLTLPAINVADVLSVEVSFTALPSTLSATDEITKISYIGL